MTGSAPFEFKCRCGERLRVWAGSKESARLALPSAGWQALEVRDPNNRERMMWAYLCKDHVIEVRHAAEHLQKKMMEDREAF